MPVREDSDSFKEREQSASQKQFRPLKQAPARSSRQLPYGRSSALFQKSEATYSFTQRCQRPPLLRGNFFLLCHWLAFLRREMRFRSKAPAAAVLVP